MVRLGACGDLVLRLTDIPPSKCHWASFVSKCSQPEHFDRHAKVQHRCYTDWLDDVWAAHVAESYEEPHVGLRHWQAAPAHTVPRPRSCRRSRWRSRNRKAGGSSRVHESTHQSVCVPMPWRKRFALTSHDISRLQSRVGMTFVHHFSYKTALCGVALRCDILNTSNKPPPRSSNDMPVGKRRPRYMDTKQHAAAIDWRYERWRPAGRHWVARSRWASEQQARERDSVLGRYDATRSAGRSSSTDGHSSSRGPRGTGRRRVVCGVSGWSG